MKKIGLILGLLNTVAIAAVLGFFVYTKMLYKRPAITEGQERTRLASPQYKQALVQEHKKALIPLDPITANLDPYVDGDGKKKLHYVAISLVVEVGDETQKGRFEEIKPIVMDQVIQSIGKKTFDDLNQVQGRYLLRSQIIDATNAYLKEPLITEVYISDYLLQ